MTQRGGASVDIPSDIVGIGDLKFRGIRRGLADDAVPKPGRKSLDLSENGSGVVCIGAMRHMTVGPGGVPIVGGAAGIEEAALSEQDKWRF